MWGIPVSLRFNFFTCGEIACALRDAGFVIEQIAHRAPYPNVEVETDRLYAIATKTHSAVSEPRRPVQDR